MKLHKTELAAIALTVVVSAAVLGFRLGRDSGSASFGVSVPENPEKTVTRSLPAAEPDTARININEAGKEELCLLPGIGEVLAERIVTYREENGNFEKIEDITKVSGIGIGTFEKIRDSIAAD